MGLPQYNVNSKVQTSGKSKDLWVKSRTETYFQQTNISRELLSRKNRLRSETYDKCSFSSIFDLIFFKLLPQIASVFSVTVYFRPRKKSPKAFLDRHQTAAKNTGNKNALSSVYESCLLGDKLSAGAVMLLFRLEEKPSFICQCKYSKLKICNERQAAHLSFTLV